MEAGCVGRTQAAPLSIERQVIRAILITPEQEILLLRYRPQDSDDFLWFTRGGGLEPDETREDGLRRELKEDLGLEDFQMGPMVWQRQNIFNKAKQVRQNEEYYVVHVARFGPHVSDAVEAKWLHGFRWWPVSELAKTNEHLSPVSLARVVVRYVEDGRSQDGPEAEVLFD